MPPSFVPDERGQMRPATAEEKGAVLIASSIPVRPSETGISATESTV